MTAPGEYERRLHASAFWHVAVVTQVMLPFKYSRAKSATSCIRQFANLNFQEAMKQLPTPVPDHSDHWPSDATL
jgi:hypothetical protein